MEILEKSRENNLRKRLKKMGYMLKKSRARNIHLDNFGGYMICDGYTGCVIEGRWFHLTLNDVEDFIDM